LIFGKVNIHIGGHAMRKVNFKGRCEKRVLSKCKSVFKSYDPIQNAYADVLEANIDIGEIQCNVPLGDDCSEYMSDFVCRTVEGELIVRECINRKLLIRPLTGKLLDMSRTYWLRRGVNDWGIVTDATEE
jgi:hypothetical protein